VSAPERLCQCACDAWGHPGTCDGRDCCEVTATRPRPEWDLWPGANAGTFRLCPPCLSALKRLQDRIALWDMNIEAFGYPTLEMLHEAEYRRLMPQEAR
jgi:hypothetical protein